MTSLLQHIDSPKDFRSFSLDKLEILASEVREKIISDVSKSGGHLAPSLGVVELTLAIHYIFNTPNDKLIWDVGHQSYAHKIVTGRRDKFHTIRQYKGLSGFPKLKESIYDSFETGHSSTSVSAALGMTLAKDIKGDKDRVIGVIGDGSMTAGMAFEGLNQAGHLDKNLIIILNDNEMSISPNVGALSSFLSRNLTSKTVNNIKSRISEKLRSLPNIGENILNILKKSEENFKNFFTPGILFEALKFDYIGPINGHDIEELVTTLRNVRDNMHGPVLIHVLTKKGKGFKPAEDSPGDYHGVGPFDIKTGNPLSSDASISYTKVFGNTVIKLATEDPKIVAISAAMPTGTGLTPFAKQFPTRFFDVGIAEQHAITFAAGLAIEGMRPIVAIYSSFFQRSMDQIIHDVCIPNLPVTLAIDRGGVVGDDGETHHGVFDISFLRFIPNLVFMAPKDENELQHMLYTSTYHNGPSAIRYPRGNGEGVELSPKLEKYEIGKGELLRKGDDILLLPVGNRVYPAMAAAKGLSKLGVEAAVINPRFIKPLDRDLICKWSKHTGAVLTIEDNVAQGGFGSAVLETISKYTSQNIKTKILAHPDHFIEHASQEILWKKSGIDSTSIIQSALSLIDPN